MTGRVLVTGISGFIGSHIALALLYAGYTVRGSLRDMRRAGEVAAMLERTGADLNHLEFVPLDLSDDAGWTDAMSGVRYLQHVASPIATSLPKDRNELIIPAVEGTRRAIGAALEAGVERIVMTSSTAAIAYGHLGDRTAPYTDADWTASDGEDVNAYTESKTRAELEAWSLVEEAGRRADFATINPSVVLGPLLGADAGVSAEVIRRLLNGTPVAPEVSFNVVDVRDVAALHLAAMTTPLAGGHRFIAAAAPVTTFELVGGLRSSFPDYASRLPRFALPHALVRFVALFSREVQGITPNLGRVRLYDATSAEALLGRPFITPRLAAAATAQSLIDFGLVRPPAAQKRG
jgi:nucleoside-diphosphate-sugar epimerase